MSRTYRKTVNYMQPRMYTVTVHTQKQRGKWYAGVDTAGPPIEMGIGNTEEEAYDDWAKKNNATLYKGIHD